MRQTVSFHDYVDIYEWPLSVTFYCVFEATVSIERKTFDAPGEVMVESIKINDVLSVSTRLYGVDAANSRPTDKVAIAAQLYAVIRENEQIQARLERRACESVWVDAT